MNSISRSVCSLIFNNKHTLLSYLVNSRAITIRWWPTIDNPWRENLEVQHAPANMPEYSVSKDEFKYVELLKPCDLVPPPPNDNKKNTKWMDSTQTRIVGEKALHCDALS
uniref:39S ribosomal protein L49 n=1 Tax=Schistocephalus solidus TaxID=70667 RepID=A0A0X3NK31_SCHSO